MFLYSVVLLAEIKVVVKLLKVVSWKVLMVERTRIFSKPIQIEKNAALE